MSDSIEDVFTLLQKDVEQFVKSTSIIFLHNSSKAIVEAWANEIIDMIVTKNVQPPLDEKTIERRKRRGKDVLGPDHPLLETGEWIAYIEFKINQFTTHDEIEVGVFDDSTSIGHSVTKTPVFIAEINEYGMEDVNIPGRHLFSTSELKINSKIETIINDAWNKLQITDLPNVQNINSMVGRISSNGAEFIFRWDEEY